MLSAEAYSFRQKSRLAISLSWIGGYTNIIAVVACGTFASNHTGTATLVSRYVGEGDWGQAGFFGYLLATFLIGVMASAAMTEIARRRGVASKYVLPLAIEAVALSVMMLQLHLFGDTMLQGAHRYETVGVASFAMGLQNATITKISGAVVRSTHLTGVLTDLGVETVQFALWWIDQLRGRTLRRAGRLLRVSQRHPSFLRLALLASITGSFMLGALVGTLLYGRIHELALIPPIAFLTFIFILDITKPIPDIRELDLLSDPELKAHGLIQTILPAEIGMFRVTYTRKDGVHRAPNFGMWIDRLPVKKRIVVLVLTPWMALDSNALLDLNNAVEKLRVHHRRLILSGITPVQYRKLDHEGLVDKIGAQNICPDLEFAIALAGEALREQHLHEHVGVHI